MRKYLLFFFLPLVQMVSAQFKVNPDWLLDPKNRNAEINLSADAKNIILDNGLVRRKFVLSPNLACTDYLNHSSNEQMLRAISPEAWLTIDGKSYAVGGLLGQTEKAYLNDECLDTLKTDLSAFQFKTYSITSLSTYVKWKPSETSWPVNQPLQAAGRMVTFTFASPLTALKGIVVNIHYELYNGMPLICKWLSVENKGDKSVVLNKIVNEILAVPEEESAVAGLTSQFKKPHGIYVESNYAFNNSMTARFSDQTSHWNRDSTYTSQVNVAFNTSCVLEVYPPVGPGIVMGPGGSFTSIRTYELLLDSYDRERNGLAQRKMYRGIAPWTIRNPIFMHLISVDPAKVRAAVDQCAAVGYEGIILSFGSGINMEDTSAENIRHCRELADYAHHKGILLGGYSLFSSRRISDEEDVIDPKTGKADVHALFEHAPCLGSKWGLAYLHNLKEFIKKTGFDLFENDGPYPGDVCASTKHPGHRGLEDSQWAQMELQKDLYHWCSENGIYVNAPDWYFLDGTNKIALGYREVNFSLPREQQIMLNRQNIYDGTWEKTPSMSWGFVPLTEYHGGGTRATLEPLNDHLETYEQLMMQYYGAGIQACYRGPRLYDTEVTKQMVKRVISWYKRYRTVLNADIIHLRRPDGRDWDGILHVDPKGKEKGLLMLFNPTNEKISRQIKVPLYYTGLVTSASIREKEGASRRYKLDGQKNVYMNIQIPANSYTWLVVQ